MKSNVSDHLEMVTSIYQDACAKCIADVSDLRDLVYIRSRVEEEGVSFLTITLPTFIKSLNKALRLGQIDPTDFRSFRKSGAIPAFLQGMLGLIFDRETGRINDKQNRNFQTKEAESKATNRKDTQSDESRFGGLDGHSVIIGCIRQICLAFEKTEITCDPKRVAGKLAEFANLEHSLEEFSVPIEDSCEFKHVSSVLWDNVMVDINLSDVLPRHGPGATAEHISGNQKYVWRYWYERLEPFFPFLGTAYSIGAYDSKELENVTFISPELELPVRVVTVPKTSKGPRIIAIEPSCMQYAQQAIRSILYRTIESSELTKGHVNFRSQSVNQELALMSSRTGLFATIDLSDASDRVPRDLALEMFRSNPDLRDAIDACRSTYAEMPDGSRLGPLRKFASMGSALCFPVESMYFYTICVAASLRARNLPVSHANVFVVSRDVYVYGDDIIVPTSIAVTVLNYLQKYNCKVNDSKTFLSGSFRESCGVDAYDGDLVTPVYIRKMRPKSRHHVSELISWVATANQFYKNGYWRTAQLMWHTCERILGPLPYVSETSSALGRVSYLGYRSIERWNPDLQRFENKAWKPRSVYRSDSIDGHSALMKSLLLLEAGGVRTISPPDKDPRHLERFALHHAVALQRGWVPAL